jgi:hypothetical protein
MRRAGYKRRVDGGSLSFTLLLSALVAGAWAGVDAARDAHVAERIAGLPEGGSAGWDELVRLLLLANYDVDESGAVDAATELEVISCPVWRAVDAGVRERWPAGLWVTYGVIDGATFIGEAIGVAPELRRALDRKLTGCKLIDARFLGASLSGRDPTARLRSLGAASDSRWEARVAAVMVDAFDVDRDGVLGHPDELLAIPCSVWTVLDQRVHDAGRPGLVVSYGIEGAGAWTADRLGFDVGVREVIVRSVRSCTAAPALELPRATSPEVVAETLRGLPHADPATWEPAVRRLLLAAFDRSGDRTLDTAEEARALDCAVWGALDAAVLGVRGQGLYDAYGFDPMDSWEAYALGFHASVRAIATDALHGCGLDRPERPLANVAEALYAVPPGPGWQEAVGAVLVGALDADGSGAVDAADEAERAPCAVWEALDGVVLRSSPGGLYVLARGGLDALGVRGEAAAAAVVGIADCGLAPGRTVGTLARHIAVIERPDGTSAWDLAAAALLLRAVDQDASGWIDRQEEVRAVPCETWRVLEQTTQDAWGRGLLPVYGFVGRGPWWGDDLGFAWSARRSVADTLRACLEPTAK